MSIFGYPFGFQGVPKSAPGPRRDPPERVGMVFAIRWFPTLRCTLPHITFSSGHLLRWVYLQVPCDSSRAKGGVFGASEIEDGFQNLHFLLPKSLLFSLFLIFSKITKICNFSPKMFFFMVAPKLPKIRISFPRSFPNTPEIHWKLTE